MKGKLYLRKPNDILTPGKPMIKKAIQAICRSLTPDELYLLSCELDTLGKQAGLDLTWAIARVSGFVMELMPSDTEWSV